MDIKKMLDKWYDKEIEDYGGYTSPMYEEFQRDYRNTIKDFCKKINMKLHDFHKNHYEFCAVLQDIDTQKYYYISISDVRFWKNEWADNILYRTMEHDKDWRGGSNCYSNLEDLPNNLMSIKKIWG